MFSRHTSWPFILLVCAWFLLAALAAVIAFPVGAQPVRSAGTSSALHPSDSLVRPGART